MRKAAALFSMMKQLKFVPFLTLLALPTFAEEKPYGEDAPADEVKQEEKKAPSSLHAFSWPFVEWEKMQPRGGTTEGSKVTLRTEPKDAWKELQSADVPNAQKDRLAILALAGSYRVSFDFIETLGFSNDYTPPRPYFSWGTEVVTVLKDEPNFISLQHALVMYFEDENGEVDGPHVMKHWRQDWTYEDPSLVQYLGNNSWKKLPALENKGKWSQAVYQVDDSPRYEVLGQWEHGTNLHTWRSDAVWRPLPRREFSVREDYNVLDGYHEITLTPTGWVHVQNNRKLKLDEGVRAYIGAEIGFDRYEEITEPDLSTAFNQEWVKTAPYWAAVRDEWKKVFDETGDSIELKKEVDGKKLWQTHFEFAAQIGGQDAESELTPEQIETHARETVRAFLK